MVNVDDVPHWVCTNSDFDVEDPLTDTVPETVFLDWGPFLDSLPSSLQAVFRTSSENHHG